MSRPRQFVAFSHGVVAVGIARLQVLGLVQVFNFIFIAECLVYNCGYDIKNAFLQIVLTK